MPYCHNCGKPVNETDRFCASCFVELFLRDSPHNGVRRFPTPLPEQTRTRLLTPDSKGTEQTRDYGKTRLIDYAKKETEPTPASGKTRLIGPDREESQSTAVSGKTRLIGPDREESQPTPASGKTRLIGPDREESQSTAVSGKTRLIGPDREESQSNAVSGKTRLIGPDREESQSTAVLGKTRLIGPDREESQSTVVSGKTRLIDPDREESQPTPASGKTRLIDDSNKEGLVAEDIPSSKSFPQQTESFKTRLISDSERPGTSKAAGKEVSFAKIDLLEFEIARANARKYKKARNTWLVLAIIFLCAAGAFVPLYVVADDEARHLRWNYNDIKQEQITERENYETQLSVKQKEYEELWRDYRVLESNYNDLKKKYNKTIEWIDYYLSLLKYYGISAASFPSYLKD